MLYRTEKEYTDGMNLLSPKEIDFTPKRLQRFISRELGLTKPLEDSSHNLRVIFDKNREASQAEKGLIDYASVIPQPFLPFNLSSERMKSCLKF